MIASSQALPPYRGQTRHPCEAIFPTGETTYAFSPEAQQTCAGDALRLCSAEIPDIPRITACMMKQRMSLRAGCKSVMDRDLAQRLGSK